MLAQANVNENEPASLYVDAAAGSDSNPGTQSQPLKTIAAAANKANLNNTSGIGTKVWINPGVYRESVFMYGSSKLTSAPVTFQAVTTGTAIIDGADVVTGWAQSGSNSSIYTHSWTYSEGTCSLPSGWPSVQPIVLQREMVFVNGAPLTQVLSASQMQPGTFYLNTSTKQMSIWPGSGISINTATVEIANRPVISRSITAQTLLSGDWSYSTVQPVQIRRVRVPMPAAIFCSIRFKLCGIAGVD